MIKAIFFDLGDVITHNTFKLVLADFAKNLKVDFESLAKLNDEYKDKLMTGKMSVKEMCQILKDRLNLSLTVEEIYEICSRTYDYISVLNEELFNFAKELKKKYIIGMISNVYDLMAKIERERGIFDIFYPCILSCEVGLQKPNREIFELALKRTNLKADECIFIDNKEIHLTHPKEMGFNEILFENNDKTINKLKELLKK